MAEEEFEVPTDKMLVAAASTLDKQPGINFLTESSHQRYQTILDKIARRYKPEYVPDFVTVTFVVSTSGNISHIQAYDHKGTDWADLAEKIVSECEFRYTAGIIDGKSVASEVYLPVSLKPF